MFRYLVTACVLVLSTNGTTMDNLFALACTRDPTFEMCGGGRPNGARFRRSDDIDVETRMLRSFPKISFDQLQLDRYCLRHKNLYRSRCWATTQNSEDQVVKFCSNFEKFCKDAVTQASEDEWAEAEVPFALPPPLPGKQKDKSTSQSSYGVPVGVAGKTENVLSPEVIKTCTAACTAPHCTLECKCAHTRPTVRAICNSPADAQIEAACKRWNTKCHMFPKE